MERPNGKRGPLPGATYRKLVPLIADKDGKPVYDEERMCRVVRNLCLLGLTDEQIAGELGVGLSTYYRMREEHPVLDQTVRTSKALADGEVAANVFKIATGFKKTERRVVVTKDGVEVVPVEVEIDGDAKIGMQWLRQRQGNVWREKIIVEDASADKAAIAEYARRIAEAEAAEEAAAAETDPKE
jgi:hypothetical protein